MSKNVSMNIRVDESTRTEAESIFEQLGLTMSGAINMFLKQVVREKAVPLSMELDPMFTSRTVKEDMEEARKLRAGGMTGVDADDLAAQMDTILARDATEKQRPGDLRISGAPRCIGAHCRDARETRRAQFSV